MSPAAKEALEILIEELRHGAAGPCDYWYRRLAERLFERLHPIKKQDSNDQHRENA